MEKLRITGTGHIQLVHSLCLCQILIRAFWSYWESEAGVWGRGRQWRPCPDRLAVRRRQHFTSSSSQSCPSQSPKGTGETWRLLPHCLPWEPSPALCPWSTHLAIARAFSSWRGLLVQLQLLCSEPPQTQWHKLANILCSRSLCVRNSVQMAYLPHDVSCLCWKDSGGWGLGSCGHLYAWYPGWAGWRITLAGTISLWLLHEVCASHSMASGL